MYWLSIKKTSYEKSIGEISKREGVSVGVLVECFKSIGSLVRVKES